MKNKIKNLVSKIKNSENKKSILLIILLLVVVVGGIFVIIGVFGKDKNASIDKENAVYTNDKEAVVKEQKVEGLLMEEVDVKYSESTSSLNLQVTNTTGEAYYLDKVNIKCLDKDGNVLIVLTGDFDQELAKDESATLEVGTTFNLGDVDKIEYELVKEEGE